MLHKTKGVTVFILVLLRVRILAFHSKGGRLIEHVSEQSSWWNILLKQEMTGDGWGKFITFTLHQVKLKS